MQSSQSESTPRRLTLISLIQRIGDNRQKSQSIIFDSLALILYSVYSIKYYCQHGMGVELVSFSTRFSTKSIFNISFSLLLFSAIWPDEFSNSMSLEDWCLSFLQHLEHSSSDFWDTLVQNICIMYEPISKMVISEKPMQRPRIPPQLAMNQIIGTWKNTE